MEVFAPREDGSHRALRTCSANGSAMSAKSEKYAVCHGGSSDFAYISPPRFPLMLERMSPSACPSASIGPNNEDPLDPLYCVQAHVRQKLAFRNIPASQVSGPGIERMQGLIIHGKQKTL